MYDNYQMMYDLM